MVPVHRPLLPTMDKVAPYLERIDRTRHYTNFGPLVRQLEERLAEHFGAPHGGIVMLSNATLGLQLALSALEVTQGSLCLMPAWTFVASPLAAMGSGLTPYFVDVDPETWSLSPEIAKAALKTAPGLVGAVMPVSPFGSPTDGRLWDQFTDDTGIPAVIDAAAGFDTLRPSRSLAVVSLHATKVLGVGEGAFVASTDRNVIEEIKCRSNFGFQRSRDSITIGTNAKLSEYQAAIAHAALDEWASMRSQWIAVANSYKRALSSGISIQSGFGATWISSTLVVKFGVSVSTVEDALSANTIETRRWWGAGAHRHPATALGPRGDLPTTERLIETTIGLPFFRDLSEHEIAEVARLLDRVASICP